jgi:O-Antigen ligase
MLTYFALALTGYLVLEIVRAPSCADATGYLLVSGLIPLPVSLVGRSPDAGIFSVDICLLAFILAHGGQVAQHLSARGVLHTGVGVLFCFSILATLSGILNFLLTDPDALKFYAYTIVKFWEYVLLAAALIATRPDGAQLRRACTIVLAGILVYEVLHVLHITGALPLSGEQYFGPRAAEYESLFNLNRAAPFSDRTGWFLTSYRVVVGGTASISAWFSLFLFESSRGMVRFFALAAAVLAGFSVLATSSRSDIVGLGVAVVVFLACSPRRRWRAYASAVVAVACLYTSLLVVLLPREEADIQVTRLRELWSPELRASGSYADRSADRQTMLKYLPENPRNLLIGAGPGNFHWYYVHGITNNFYGHNSYLHWTGELGVGGLVLLLGWCFSVLMLARNRLHVGMGVSQLAALVCLALVAGRIVAAWGAESLFGTESMGPYSLFFVGIVYLLLSIAWVPMYGSNTLRQPTSASSAGVKAA